MRASPNVVHHASTGCVVASAGSALSKAAARRRCDGRDVRASDAAAAIPINNAPMTGAARRITAGPRRRRCADRWHCGVGCVTAGRGRDGSRQSARRRQTDVERRREQQPEQRDAKHPREDGGAQRLARFRAGAGGDDQRHDAENEGERRHQNRPQPLACGVGRRLESIEPELIFSLLREFDDQDGVLAREPDEHDETDLREDVVVLSAKQHAGDRRQEAHRHDQHDRERQRHALVLSGQHEKDDDDRKDEDERRGVARLLLLDTPGRSTRRKTPRAASVSPAPPSCSCPGRRTCLASRRRGPRRPDRGCSGSRVSGRSRHETWPPIRAAPCLRCRCGCGARRCSAPCV